MPEILILCEYPTLNGGERSMLATLDGVRAGGFTPVVITPADGPLAAELATRGFELIPFQRHAADGSRFPQNQLRKQLAELFQRRRPTLLHANSLAMGRLSGPVAADCRLPSIAHLRDIIKLSPQAVVDLNRHRRLLAVSEATREFHVIHGLDGKKTHAFYNGVDLEQFRPRPPTGYLHRELAVSADTELIGNIGQIGLRKGQDTLLGAAAMVADRYPTAHFLIIGERNSEKAESQRFETALHDAARCCLTGRVHFLGRRNDVPLLLNELTMLVHSARQEPLGRVLLEAAASGLAIVATNVGGTREIFSSETDAVRLVPPDDAALLAEAMLELLGNDELRCRLGSAARRCTEERFDIRKTVGELIRHYQATMP
jgi:glycosyltransferase involved in cell wall biosynthesis